MRYAERVDPFTLVKAEIDSVSERLRRGILSGIPVLERAAEYFFKVRSGSSGTAASAYLQRCHSEASVIAWRLSRWTPVLWLLFLHGSPEALC